MKDVVIGHKGKIGSVLCPGMDEAPALVATHSTECVQR